MKKHLRYLSYVVRHKWFVLAAGRERGVGLWRLVIHDWHKFLPSEWFAYVENFYGRDDEYYRQAWRIGVALRVPRAHRLSDPTAFDRAWLKHQHRAPHHWQHWVLRNDDGSTRPLPMPERYWREMLADWDGAGRAITGKSDTAGWYAKNRDKIVLHPDTQASVEAAI